MPNDDLEKLLRTEDKKTLVIENSSKYKKSCFAPCWYFCLFMIQYA